MAEQMTSGSTSASLVNLPSNPVGYVAVLLALVTAGIHLWLGPRVMGFSQMMGTLFILNGLGFLGGLAVYLSRYWRREFYLVAAAYASLTVLAFFGFQGFGIDAFYQRGSLNQMAVIAKSAEFLLVVLTVYLYRERTV